MSGVVQVPLQVATERALAQLYYRREGRTLAAADWNVALSGFAHPPVDDFSLVCPNLQPSAETCMTSSRRQILCSGAQSRPTFVCTMRSLL